MKTETIPGSRLAILGKNSIELQPFDVRPPGDAEVVIETRYSLLSTGTETIVFSRNFDPGTHWDAWVRYPFYPGYASVGRVVAAGSAVECLELGDRVVSRTGHASHSIIDAARCFRIPDGVEDLDAVWFALAKISGHGVRAANIELGAPVAVIGAGPIGQMAIRWAMGAGAGKVAAVDIAPERLELAARAGAIPVEAPAAEAAEKVRLALGERPVAAIDSTGNAEVLKSVFGMVENEGTVVLLGDTGTPGAQTLTGDVISRGLKLVGAHDGLNSPRWNNAVAAATFFDFLKTGRFSTRGLVTHRFHPAQCVEAYRCVCTERRKTMGVVFEWGAKIQPSSTAKAEPLACHA